MEAIDFRRCVELYECTALQEALKHIHPPADASAAAADALEDSRLTAGARFSSQQKRVLVDLREAIYTNLGRSASVCYVPLHSAHLSKPAQALQGWQAASVVL